VKKADATKTILKYIGDFVYVEGHSHTYISSSQRHECNIGQKHDSNRRKRRSPSQQSCILRKMR